MPSPIPKDPKLRQRRNKSVSRRVLYLENNNMRPPALPKTRTWHPEVRRWWKSIWASPMAGEYLEADVPALLILANLIDRFWNEPNVALAGEIRQRQACFGLTPLDRRRLEWQVVQVEEAKEKAEGKRSRRAKIVDDPRGVLE